MRSPGSHAMTLAHDGRLLLLGGVLLRVLVFVCLSPFNNDDHWTVVRYIAEHARLPVAGEMDQSYHPPLYYLLAQPFLRLTGTAKGVQALSLVLSIGTLVALHRLLYRSSALVSESARDSTFALACFLPQFVLYTLFVSNDSLAIFLGALTALQIFRFAETGRVNDLMGLAVLTALGLLTKHTFVAFVPVLVGLVWLARRQRPTGPRPLTAVMLFVAIALIPGSYKTVENMRTSADRSSRRSTSPMTGSSSSRSPIVGGDRSSTRTCSPSFGHRRCR